MSQENIDRLLRRPGSIRNPLRDLLGDDAPSQPAPEPKPSTGEDAKNLYHVDVNNNGYKTQEDYQKGQNKLEQGSDGKYYPRQYGKG